MKVGGNRNRLVGSQEFAKGGKLQERDNLVDYHESVVPYFGSIEAFAHRPYPRRALIAEVAVLIGEEFQVRAFSRSTGSVKNEQAFLLEGLTGQPEKVVKAVGRSGFPSHALKNSSWMKTFGLPWSS
jgi:hypothetical protein